MTVDENLTPLSEAHILAEDAHRQALDSLYTAYFQALEDCDWKMTDDDAAKWQEKFDALENKL